MASHGQPPLLPPTPQQIETLALEALSRLPAPFSEHLAHVVLFVEEFADEYVLKDMEIDDPFGLTGLYTGRPVGQEAQTGDAPPTVHLYRRPLLDEWVETGVPLDALITHVVVHEIGHHFGLSDIDMHVLEDMGRAMSGAALRLRDVACLRGERLLFRGVSLDLAPGGAALLIGPNGIGKSSLLRLCAGLLRPYAGSVECEGAMAMSDERLALDQDASLERALGFWAGLDGAPPESVGAALDAMALAPLRQVPPRMLSTGQRKRAMLARVIASGAPIWLLDEPGNGLDDGSLSRLGDAIAAHLERGGILLAASHQPQLPLPAAMTIALSDYVPQVAG